MAHEEIKSQWRSETEKSEPSTFVKGHINSEAVKVILRVRPLVDEGASRSLSIEEDTHKVSLITNNQRIECQYDTVFGEGASQMDVYESVKPTVDQIIRGYNTTVFAYGQTGTGKTHTMLGTGMENRIRETGGVDLIQGEWGIIPRAISDLFASLEDKSRQSSHFSVHCSYMQIYNDRLYDLLRDQKREVPLDIRENTNNLNKKTVYVQGLSEYRVDSFADVVPLLATGARHRAQRDTEFNSHSSRSHAILQLNVEVETPEQEGRTVIHRAKFNLVDLAGSEKWGSATEKSQGHTKEMTSINTSLSSLGNCIAALTEPGRKHIPYRDSCLTRLLQDSLGGSTRTVLLATVCASASAAEETASTLQFADRAKRVMERLEMNEVVNDAVLLARAQREISHLRAKLWGRGVDGGGGSRTSSPERRQPNQLRRSSEGDVSVKPSRRSARSSTNRQRRGSGARAGVRRGQGKQLEGGLSDGCDRSERREGNRDDEGEGRGGARGSGGAEDMLAQALSELSEATVRGAAFEEELRRSSEENQHFRVIIKELQERLVSAVAAMQPEAEAGRGVGAAAGGGRGASRDAGTQVSLTPVPAGKSLDGVDSDQQAECAGTEESAVLVSGYLTSPPVASPAPSPDPNACSTAADTTQAASGAPPMASAAAPAVTGERMDETGGSAGSQRGRPDLRLPAPLVPAAQGKKGRGHGAKHSEQKATLSVAAAAEPTAAAGQSHPEDHPHYAKQQQQQQCGPASPLKEEADDDYDGYAGEEEWEVDEEDARDGVGVGGQENEANRVNTLHGGQLAPNNPWQAVTAVAVGAEDALGEDVDEISISSGESDAERALSREKKGEGGSGGGVQQGNHGRDDGSANRSPELLPSPSFLHTVSHRLGSPSPGKRMRARAVEEGGEDGMQTASGVCSSAGQGGGRKKTKKTVQNPAWGSGEVRRKSQVRGSKNKPSDAPRGSPVPSPVSSGSVRPSARVKRKPPVPSRSPVLSPSAWRRGGRGVPARSPLASPTRAQIPVPSRSPVAKLTSALTSASDRRAMAADVATASVELPVEEENETGGFGEIGGTEDDGNGDGDDGGLSVLPCQRHNLSRCVLCFLDTKSTTSKKEKRSDTGVSAQGGMKSVSGEHANVNRKGKAVVSTPKSKPQSHASPSHHSVPFNMALQRVGLHQQQVSPTGELVQQSPSWVHHASSAGSSPSSVFTRAPLQSPSRVPCVRHRMASCFVCADIKPSPNAGAAVSHGSPLFGLRAGGGAVSSPHFSSPLVHGGGGSSANANDTQVQEQGQVCERHGLDACFLCSVAAAAGTSPMPAMSSPFAFKARERAHSYAASASPLTPASGLGVGFSSPSAQVQAKRQQVQSEAQQAHMQRQAQQQQVQKKSQTQRGHQQQQAQIQKQQPHPPQHKQTVTFSPSLPVAATTGVTGPGSSSKRGGITYGYTGPMHQPSTDAPLNGSHSLPSLAATPLVAAGPTDSTSSCMPAPGRSSSSATVLPAVASKPGATGGGAAAAPGSNLPPALSKPRGTELKPKQSRSPHRRQVGAPGRGQPGRVVDNSRRSRQQQLGGVRSVDRSDGGVSQAKTGSKRMSKIKSSYSGGGRVSVPSSATKELSQGQKQQQPRRRKRSSKVERASHSSSTYPAMVNEKPHSSGHVEQHHNVVLQQQQHQLQMQMLQQQQQQQEHPPHHANPRIVYEEGNSVPLRQTAFPQVPYHHPYPQILHTADSPQYEHPAFRTPSSHHISAGEVGPNKEMLFGSQTDAVRQAMAAAAGILNGPGN